MTCSILYHRYRPCCIFHYYFNIFNGLLCGSPILIIMLFPFQLQVILHTFVQVFNVAFRKWKLWKITKLDLILMFNIIIFHVLNF